MNGNHESGRNALVFNMQPSKPAVGRQMLLKEPAGACGHSTCEYFGSGGFAYLLLVVLTFAILEELHIELFQHLANVAGQALHSRVPVRPILFQSLVH